MALKVYYDLMSQPSRAVYMFLKIANIPFESHLVKLRDGEHFQESFTEIHPFRKVPAINDNGFKLIESVAIFRYLARTKNVPDHWYPADPKLQAKVDEYLEWQHTNTRIYCAMYFQHKFLRPMMFQKPVDEKKVARFQEEMEKCLGDIQNIWLDGGKKKYITGDKISVADLAACTELEQPGMAGYDIFTKYPVIGAYRDRVRQETGPAYEDAHKIVRIMTNKFKGVPQINKL